jgi:hypothetical protein
VRTLRFDWPTAANPNRWEQHGWDLDSTCTTQSRTIATCLNPGGVVNDGSNGRDNAFASRLGPFLQTLMGVSEERINLEVGRGAATLGIELRGYNGTGDDSEVTAILFPLVNGRAGENNGAPPRWDGTDIWSLDKTLVIPPEQATSRGYIAGSRLVLRLRSQTPHLVRHVLRSIAAAHLRRHRVGLDALRRQAARSPRARRIHRGQSARQRAAVSRDL